MVPPISSLIDPWSLPTRKQPAGRLLGSIFLGRRNFTGSGGYVSLGHCYCSLAYLASGR
jgi:hypothetical protein